MTFTVKAGYSDSIDLKTTLETAREFFSNVGNFVDLMPGVQKIHIDAKGVAHWEVEVEVPVVGKISQRFAVVEGEPSEDSVERLPLVSQNVVRGVGVADLHARLLFRGVRLRVSAVHYKAR